MKRVPHNQIWFGTDGIREKVGQGPLTIEHLPRLGFVIGQWLVKRYGAYCKVLIGHDTRISCSFIKAALESCLLLQPLVVLDAQTLPTPAVCHLVKESDDIKAGIIVTASHNRYQDNGIKLINSTGAKIKNDAAEIEQLFAECSITNHDYTNLGQLTMFNNAADTYISGVCKRFAPLFLSGTTIALDCAHGAFSTIAPQIFESLGANVIAINNQPDGKNINDNCGALHTESLIETVKKSGADIGFACDGDGDRLVVVSNDGVKKDGDDILALLSQHTQYADEKAVVGTIMSNEGFNAWLAKGHKKLLRTDVGEPSVIEEINRSKLMLGGEPSGHIVLNDYLGSSDAVFTALRLLEIIIQTNNWKLETFERYPQINLAVPVKEKLPLDQPHLARIIQQGREQLPNGRLIIRYSGTEQILRITAEDRNKEHTEAIAQNIAKQFKEKLC